MKAKKSLGQNFLKSKTAIDAMIRAGDIASTDPVLEIGPGKTLSGLNRKIGAAAPTFSIEKAADLDGLSLARCS